MLVLEIFLLALVGLLFALLIELGEAFAKIRQLEEELRYINKENYDADWN